MVFNVRPGGTADGQLPFGWLLAIGQDGEVAFCNSYDKPPQDTRALANGNILFSQTEYGLITETTRSGEMIRRWYATGKWRDKSPPPDAVPIDVELYHHSINVFPNGNLLLLGMEIRELPDWPGSDTDPSAPTETAKVVGDIVMEVAPDGAVIGRWHMLDMLDPYRLCYGSRAPYWVRRGFPDTMDWCHANCATYDARDGSVIVSLRTQDCIIKFDHASGELKWILGAPGNWKPPWSDKLLEPIGEVAWQFHQHDCSITPRGTLLCFDNGNYRALPFADKLPPENNHSRAVEFEIDEAAGTVRQVWSHGRGVGQGTYACYQGGAFRLPRTGNTFVTYGGIVDINGAPSDLAQSGFCRSRLVEVTNGGDVVFDMWIDGSGEDEPVPLSVFRAEHLPATG